MLKGIPREQWSGHSVREVMRTDFDILAIPPETDALDALSKMLRNDIGCLVVIEGGRVMGTICLADVLRFLHLKLDLAGPDDDDNYVPPVVPPRRISREVGVG